MRKPFAPGAVGYRTAMAALALFSPLICPDIEGYNDSMVIISDFLSVSVNKADGMFIAVTEASPRAKP